jgi:ABC-2 type transport system ATP-binding protein
VIRPASGRAAARIAAALALLVGGIAALRSLPLSGSTSTAFPELLVEARGTPRFDLNGVAREAIAPIEEMARRIGGLEDSASTVDVTGASVRLRFARGTDLAAKRAALEVALTPLRARLGSAFSLSVASGAEEGDLLQAVVWLGGRDDHSARDFATAVRTLPGVASVTSQGLERDEIWLRLDPEVRGDLNGLMRSLRRAATASSPLGEIAGGGVAEPAAGEAADGWSRDAIRHVTVPLHGRAVSVPALGRIERASAPADEQIDRNGKPGRALLVWRDADASPWRVGQALDRMLDKKSRARRPLLLFDAAEPLRRLVRRLAIVLALLSASLLVFGSRNGLRGAFLGFLLAPLATAGAVVAIHLVSPSLTPAVLAMLPVAVSGAVVSALLRWSRPESRGEPILLIASGLALPLALLVIGDAAPLGAFQEPLRGFAAALTGAVAAGALLPFPAPHLVTATARRPLRALLRDRATTLLAGLAIVEILFAFAGTQLTPVAGSLERIDTDLTLELHRPEGTTLDETVATTHRIEKRLAELAGVEETWSRTSRLQASIAVRLDSRHRSGGPRDFLLAKLRLSLPEGATLHAAAADPTAGVSLLRAGELGHPLHAEQDPHVLPLLLRADSIAELRRGRDLLIQRLRQRLTSGQIQVGDQYSAERPASGPPSGDETRDIDTGAVSAKTGSTLGVRLPPTDTWVILKPLRGASSAALGRVNAALAERLSSAVRLPAERADEPDLRVVPAGVEVEPETVVRRREAIDLALRASVDTTGSPATAAAMPVQRLFAVEERPVEIRVDHEGGRFALPFTILLSDQVDHVESRRAQLKNIAILLSQASLGPGCSLELADWGVFAAGREIAPIAGAGALVLALWWAILATRLNSWRGAFACCVPLLTGAAFAATLLVSLASPSDELTLALLAAALSITLPAAAAVAAVQRGGVTAAYRETARLTPALGAGLLVAALVAAAVACGADISREPWAAPLGAAAAAGGGGMAAALLLLPPLLASRRKTTASLIRAEAPAILRARNITKIYPGGLRALNRVSFDLGPGIVGLLGPNGSGKTTLMRTLMGLLEPTRGQVSWKGAVLRDQALTDFRRSVGFLPQEFSAYPALSGHQFLAHWARARGITPRPGELDELIATVGLAEHAGRRVRSYSGGMRRRLGIAAALIGDPPVLLVDEPTAGLDLASRTMFREILLAAASRRLVLLSTHIASDVEAVASRLLVLGRGRLRFDGAPAELLAAARGRVDERVIADGETSELRALERELRVTAHVRVLEGVRVRVVLRPGEEPRGRMVEPSLEEAYLALLDR